MGILFFEQDEPEDPILMLRQSDERNRLKVLLICSLINSPSGISLFLDRSERWRKMPPDSVTIHKAPGLKRSVLWALGTEKISKFDLALSL